MPQLIPVVISAVATYVGPATLLGAVLTVASVVSPVTFGTLVVRK
jgi:hypothetical protein